MFEAAFSQSLSQFSNQGKNTLLVTHFQRARGSKMLQYLFTHQRRFHGREAEAVASWPEQNKCLRYCKVSLRWAGGEPVETHVIHVNINTRGN